MKLGISIFLLIKFGFILGTNGQSIPQPPVFPEPVDANVKTGVLDNGFRYYIKLLSEPHAKLSMKLLVKTGFSYEEEHELNMAHHIEHLAFRQTANFPKGLSDNPELLNQLNMSSRDMTGTTSHLYTSYSFEPPTSNERALKIGLRWFRDIADGLDFSQANIDRERGVLLQEFQFGGNSATRSEIEKVLGNKLNPCNPDYSKLTDKIRTFPYSRIREFHKKWYRPDLMAITLVGNIRDIEEIERNIRKMFSTIKIPVFEKPEITCPSSYLLQPPGFSHVTYSNSLEGVDSDRISYYLIFKDSVDLEKSDSIDRLKIRMTGEFLANILNNRLKESLRTYGNTYEYYSGYERVEYPYSLKLKIDSKIREENIALGKAVAIVNQFQSHGITQTELQRIKENKLEVLSLTDTSGASYWNKQIKNHFVFHEPLPVNKTLKLKEWIENLSIEDLNARLAQLISVLPDDIGVIAPESYEGLLTRENHIKDFISLYFQSKTEIYEPKQDEPVLMNKNEVKSLLLAPILELEKDIPGTQKFQLRNGIKVVLKPMKVASKDQGTIRLHGFAPIGASHFPKGDYYSAMFAPYIIRHSGIGELDKFKLEDVYKSIGLPSRLFPYLELNESGITGNVESKDLEILLQIIYLYFTQPREDWKAFLDWKSVQESSSSANSINDVLDALREVTGDLTKLPLASRQVSASKKVEFKRAFSIYNEIFGNAQDFTFILTGDFDEQDVKGLIRRYLGSLPNNSTREPVQRYETDRISGPQSYRFPFPTTYQSNNSTYGFKFVRENGVKNPWKEEIKVRALGAVLNRMLFMLRSEDGFSIYHIAAGGSYNRELNRFELTARLNCTPLEFDLIKKRIFEILEKIKNANISEAIVNNGLQDLKFAYRIDKLEQPRAVSDKLYRYYRYQESAPTNSEIQNFIESLSVDDIAQMADIIFRKEFFYEVLLSEEVEDR